MTLGHDLMRVVAPKTLERIGVVRATRFGSCYDGTRSRWTGGGVSGFV